MYFPNLLTLNIGIKDNSKCDIAYKWDDKYRQRIKKRGVVGGKDKRGVISAIGGLEIKLMNIYEAYNCLG